LKESKCIKENFQSENMKIIHMKSEASPGNAYLSDGLCRFQYNMTVN
jgi:hypothetical protein